MKSGKIGQAVSEKKMYRYLQDLIHVCWQGERVGNPKVTQF